MELKDIKAIIDLMTKNGLSEFELEKDEFKIRVKRAGGAYDVVAPVAYAPTPMPALTAIPAPASAPVAPAEERGETIDSPMVGTFYGSPSPDAPFFVKVGQEVTEDTVVCIIEAMKVMNEIKAEKRGIITQIVAENGKPVEFGAPLFRIKPV